MTCPYRQQSAYSASCTFSGECAYQSAGAYLLTCDNIYATEPVFTTEHCPYCGDNAPGACCQNPQCPAHIPTVSTVAVRCDNCYDGKAMGNEDCPYCEYGWIKSTGE